MKSRIRNTILWPIVLLLVTPLGQTLRSATFSPREYRLRLFHTHTRERLDIIYRRGETYLPQALEPNSTTIYATIVPATCIISIRTCLTCSTT